MVPGHYGGLKKMLMLAAMTCKEKIFSLFDKQCIIIKNWKTETAMNPKQVWKFEKGIFFARYAIFLLRKTCKQSRPWMTFNDVKTAFVWNSVIYSKFAGFWLIQRLICGLWNYIELWIYETVDLWNCGTMKIWNCRTVELVKSVDFTGDTICSYTDSSLISPFHSTTFLHFFTLTFPQFCSSQLRAASQFHSSTVPQIYSPIVSQFHSSTVQQFHTSTLPHFHSSTVPQSHSLTVHCSTVTYFHHSSDELHRLVLLKFSKGLHRLER